VRHVREELTALLDGALDPARRSEVEAHLAACAACRAERDGLAAALLALRALPAPPAPSPGFEARFWARLAR
jgi:anti-sigma factor RsiW